MTSRRPRLPSPAARRRFLVLLGLWLLVLASVVSWRRGSLYSGGFDATVVAKAAIAGIAGIGALLFSWRAPVRRALSPYPSLLVLTIVGVSVIGAQSAGSLVPSAVLAVRIVLLTATILLLLAGSDTGEAVGSLLTAMALIGVVAAATGIHSIHHSGLQAGRLGGGLPPLEPNELASLLLPPAIGLAWLVVRRGLRTWAFAGLVVLAGIVFATGSRTALAMLLLGALIALITAGRASRSVVAVVLVGVVGLYALAAFTPVLAHLALRGQGIDQLLSLNARTISWDAVFALPQAEWSWWLGHGLSMKTIAVSDQYWSSQVFDSSWVSSIAQDGVVGTVLLGLYAAGTVVALVQRSALRTWGLPLVVTVLIRSFVENGLVDSSATFILFFVIATAAWPGSDPLGASAEREPVATAPVRVRPARDRVLTVRP